MRPKACRPALPNAEMRRGRVAAVVGLLVLGASAAGSAMAQNAASRPVSANELAQCERAVRQALLPGPGAAAELRLATAPSVQRPLAGDPQIVLQGEGQWRDAATLRRFMYTCRLDAQGEALGVVIRQVPAPAGAAARPQPMELEPDLSHVSPSACESSAAAALTRRWPQVSQISFDADTRRLTQQSPSRAVLHGNGRAQPTPGSPSLVHFGFDCLLDPGDGRVIELRLSG
jgi:hypothetical protein